MKTCVIGGGLMGMALADKLRDYLSGIKGYHGVSCNITFKDNGRANNEVRIYTIDGNKVAKADY